MGGPQCALAFLHDHTSQLNCLRNIVLRYQTSATEANSGTPWWNRSLIGADLINLIDWMGRFEAVELQEL